MFALYKDPEGNTSFSKHQPASSYRSCPHSRNMSLSGLQDHKSTASDVESLRKRVNELESQLAAMKELQSSCGNGLDHETINKTELT